MQRRLLISEQFGVYHLATSSGQSFTGGSVRDVLRKAGETVGVKDPSQVEIIERLLGEKAEGGQIHEGLVSG